MATADHITVGLAQIAPVLLDRAQTLAKVIARIDEAAERGCHLVAFGEAIVPGYPVWLSRGDGARFDAADQKAIHSRYVDQAVCIENGDLDEVCARARRHGIAIVLGIIERPNDRGGHSLFCSCVYIDERGEIGSVHRKLMPTFEERLAWAAGDGAGLVTHALGRFRVGALNCWENWMPLARTALYAQGEDLHVAIWPGSCANTSDITRFIARESRCYVLSVSGVLRGSDIPPDTPHRERFVQNEEEIINNGGSAVAGPDGEWVAEPVVDRDALIVVELDHGRVREERQNFDPVGHYSRPDVLELRVHRRRQQALEIDDS